MTAGQTVILRTDSQRRLAKHFIDIAPVNAVVNVKEMKRSDDQNAKLWAMLSDVSRAKPQGRRHTADVWKALMMHACGHETQFLSGLDGEPFPSGFRSSRLSVSQMRELIDFVDAWGSQNGVTWTWSEAAYELDR